MGRMSPSELLKYFKTKAAIGRAIGVDRQAVQGWFDRGRVPLDQQTKFEVATSGALLADVSDEFRAVVARGRAGFVGASVAESGGLSLEAVRATESGAL